MTYGAKVCSLRPPPVGVYTCDLARHERSLSIAQENRSNMSASSVRPGSAAESFGDQVSGEVKKRRVQSLKRLFREKSRAFRERHIGAVLPVVVEASRSRGSAWLSGWTDNYLRVNLGPGEPGQAIERVRMEGLNEQGELVGSRLGDDEVR